MKITLIHFPFILLLISCSPRLVEKTSTTTIRSIDTLLSIPERKINFISSLPQKGDSIILTDRKTGVQIKIKEFISLDSILAYEYKKPLEISSVVKLIKKAEYEFELKEPALEIPVQFNEKTVKENKIVTLTKTPWYYELSFRLVVFALVAASVLLILKRFILPWFQKL